MSTGRPMLSKPTLRNPLQTSDDSNMRALLAELDRYHGVGIMMQTDRGRLISVRYNETSGEIEAWLEGHSWHSTGLTPANLEAVLGPALDAALAVATRTPKTGPGSGDMAKAVYDPESVGRVTAAENLSDGLTTLTLVQAVQLQTAGIVFTSAATYNVTTADKYIYVTASPGNNKVVQLPAATGSGQVITVKKIDDSGATVTVRADTGYPDHIDGADTVVLASQYDKVRIQDALEGYYEEQE